MSEATEPELPVGIYDALGREARDLLGMVDVPAYVRRALRVQDALEQLREKLSAQRQAWLDGVRRPLRVWNARERTAGEVPLTPLGRQALVALAAHVGPASVEPAPWQRGGTPTKLWTDLADAVGRFNQRWDRYTDAVDLTAVNTLIDGYNRFYLLEKECAFRSSRVAAIGYRPLPLLSGPALRAMFPLLAPLPTFAAAGGR